MNVKEASAKRQQEQEAKVQRKKRRTRRLLVGGLALAVITALTFGAFTAFGTFGPQTPDKAHAASKENDDPKKVSAELKKILDVANAPLKDVSCVAIIEKTGGAVTDDTYALLLETLKGVEKGNTTLRQWSDALSIPLKGKTTKDKREYVQRAICEEPIIGVSLAHLFAHLEVEGVRVLDLQSTAWLEPYNVQTGEINDIVAKFMPVTQWKLENISKKDVPEDIYVAGLKANHEYQELGSRLNLLLSKYQLGEVLNINSKHHYHLKGGGLSADSVPEVEISKEVDNKPALVFYLTKKTDDCKPISVLAFNTGDKRPMLGKTVDSCKELTTPPAAKTPPGGGGGNTPPSVCVENCGPVQPPVCTENCGPSIWKDSWTNDPWSQGNASTGGGQNYDQGPGAPTTPVQPPETPYVAPEQPVSQPPQSTPDPTPAPPQETEAPSPQAPETGYDPSAP